MPAFGFIGPGYQARGIVGESERWINMYLDPIESGMGAARPTKYQALPTPGKALLLTLDDSPVSCVVSSTVNFTACLADPTQPLFFAIGGQTLYSIQNIAIVGGLLTAAAVTIGTVEKGDIGGTGGQLQPAVIIVISPVQLFVLPPIGNAFLIGFGSAITGSSLNSGGVGYAVNDTGAVLGGIIEAVYTVTSVGGTGDVTGYTLAGGTGYRAGGAGINTQTQTGGVQPGSGTGFSIDITSVDVAAWLVTKLNGSPLAPAIQTDTFVASCTFLDGYIIAGLAADAQADFRRTFYVSGLNDFNTWSPLDFGVKEASPDPLIGVYAAFEILQVLGTQTTELWQNTGNALFPLQRLPGGGVIDTGLVNPWLICKMDQTTVWLGTDMRGSFVAWELSGSTPVRISNYALENHWSGFDLTGASIFSYTENGHTFAVFNFPIPDETWVYDSRLGPSIGWHERATWDGSQFHADLGRYHGFSAGWHVVGDYSNGNLYLQSMAFLNENCNSIRRIRTCPHLVDEKKWHFFTRFRLHCLTGVVPAGPAPIFDLRISKDGGQTYGNYLDMPIGTIGQYEHLVDWYIRVRCRDLVLEWSTSEQIDIVLVEGYIESFSGTG